MASIRPILPPLLATLVLSMFWAVPARAEVARPRAVILLDREPADAQRAAMQIRVARGRLEPAWRVEDASSLAGLAWPDPGCDPRPRDDRAGRVLQGLRGGATRFYDETDVEAARAALQLAIDAFLESPCVFADDPRGRSEATAGAVLLLRLHLLAGRPEAAADLGRRLLRTFGADELASVDVPPEVTEFLERVRDDASAALVPLEVVLIGNSPGATVLVDGRALPSGSSLAQVARGVHAVTVLAGGSARTRRVRVEGPDRVVLDLALSSLVRPGPEGTLVAVSPADLGGGLAGRLSVLTGCTVVQMSGTGGNEPVEASVVADPSGRTLPGIVLRLERAGGDGSVLAIASGPLARRKPWPWPWVTGAASAGLLAAGIVLNVQANRSADAVNAGTNRLDDWRSRRAGSIACYTLAAVAGAGTIALAILGRPAAERVVLSPIPGGAAAGVHGTF